MRCDVSRKEEVEELMATLGDVSGIIHAAGVLKTSMLKDLTQECLSDVLRPKARGAWLLHAESHFCACLPSHRLWALLAVLPTLLRMPTLTAWLDGGAAGNWLR